ncbi:beta-N-acetylhexosaminidase [Streptococcus sp. S784/96/1]|uniref:beta-N-acetylhexosaminidase n=1 Tax=Streptococcus sp. S784/96/1 TaxID=2653499 RepID=UPI001386BB65|nr:beta-N-acetylhexosaminidase [Streptococcus sp. S784/96/1]
MTIIKQEFPVHLLERLGLQDVTLDCQVSGKVILVLGSDGHYTICAEKEHQLYRGLLLLATALREGQTTVAITEKAAYSDFGYMVDCGRNCVISVDSSKQLIEDIALMGYSNYQLYLEDTFELENQPYFGYFRGRYTTEELQDIEACANSYGMDFIPCIQTLAHLSAFVRWQVKEVQDLRDVDDILLVGSEPVYDLIDQMFCTLSQLKTRRINIGMDEAFMLGLGRYLTENGYQKRSLIMCQHLERVLDIADRYGFTCSMWSDMFFHLLDAKDDTLQIDQEVRTYLNRLKERVQLIYWDYYQLTEERYTKSFERHKQLTDNIAFAGGAWKWIGYAPDNRFSLQIAPEAHHAAKKAGVEQVTITGWGDNGGECSQFSVLATLQAWAQLVYQNSTTGWEKVFETLFGLSATDFLAIDSANHPPSNPGQLNGMNPGRYILYQDILCPLLDLHIAHEEDSQYYAQVAEHLAEIATGEHRLAYLFTTQEKLCRILAVKARLSNDIRHAYRIKDTNTLQNCLDTLDTLADLVHEFHVTYSRQWLIENKVFGLDTIDIRLGGLLARIQRAHERLTAYLLGHVKRIDELEVDLLPHNDFYRDHIATTANQWHLMATASTIYTT